MLKNEHILLRALEPSDIDFLMSVENDNSQWILSQQLTPWSRFTLENYISNAHLDIHETKQLRLVISDIHNNNPMGLVDLFDFDFKNKRVGLGISIVPQFQRQGVGKQAIIMMIDYVFDFLMLHQIYVNILTNNKPSLQLFQALGFNMIGVKKDWILHEHQWYDEAFLQLTKNDLRQ